MQHTPLTHRISFTLTLTLIALCTACGQRTDDIKATHTASASSPPIDTHSARAPEAPLTTQNTPALTTPTSPSAQTPPADAPIADTAIADSPALTDDVNEADDADTLRAVAVTVGMQYSAMLMRDGTVRNWGVDDYGDLGDAHLNTEAATPISVEGITDAVALYMGKDLGHTSCVKTQRGAFQCWGNARQIPSEEVKENLQIPQDMTAPFAQLTSFALGSNGFSCGINQDQLIKCWGYGRSKRLGEVYDGKTLKVPKEVTPTLARVEEVDLGMNHACARFKKGKVACWGGNSSMQSDPTAYSDAAFPPREVPGIVGATRLFVWHDTSCALVAEGWMCWGSGVYKGPQKLEMLPADVKKLSGIERHACAILADDTLACWGENRYGQLGDGTKNSSPNALVKPEIGPVIDVAAGVYHTCAVTKDGKGYCWGYNQRGELGDGTLIDRLSPVEVKHLNAKTLPAYERGLDSLPLDQVAMTWPAPLPEGCVSASSLRLSDPAFPGLTTYQVQHAQAFITDKRKGVLMLANYVWSQSAPDGGRPRGNQSRLNITLTHTDHSGTAPATLPLDVGEYGLDEKSERTFYVDFWMRSSTSYLKDLSTPSRVLASSIQLTHVSDDWICGDINIETASAVIKGSFAAPMKKTQ